MSGAMGLIYPVPGNTDDTWGVVLNTLLGIVESHEHTSGKGVLVPAAGLGIDGDVSWMSHAITAMTALGFAEVLPAAVAGYIDALFVSSVDHNLYFRNSGGTDVKIVDGDTLNVSIVGGIGGDYSTVSALFSYDDSTKRYLAQQEGSPRPWAGIATADIDLYQKALIAGSPAGNKVTLKSPDALNASYPLIFPNTLGGSPGTGAMQVDGSGAITFTNVFAAALTAPDFHFTTARVLSIPAAMGIENGGASHSQTAFYWQTGSSSDVIAYPVPLEDGVTITAWTLFINKASNASTTISAQLLLGDSTNGTSAAIGAAVTNAANAPSFAVMAKTGLSTTVTGPGKFVELQITPTTGTPGDRFYHLEVSYTR